MNRFENHQNNQRQRGTGTTDKDVEIPEGLGKQIWQRLTCCISGGIGGDIGQEDRRQNTYDNVCTMNAGKPQKLTQQQRTNNRWQRVGGRNQW